MEIKKYKKKTHEFLRCYVTTLNRKYSLYNHKQVTIMLQRVKQVQGAGLKVAGGWGGVVEKRD